MAGNTAPDKRGLPRRKAATTIDTATAEEDVEEFHVNYTDLKSVNDAQATIQM